MAQYVDNKRLFEEFVRHGEKVKEARAAGRREPPLSDYIGLCFMRIATNMAKRPNFSSYSYIDEMIGDGIENCIIAANNFDTNQRQKNPFGYFSQIVFWAFLRRIEKEKKQNYLKYKSLQNAMTSGGLFNGNSEDFKGMSVTMDETYMNDVVSKFEESREERKAKSKEPRKKRGVERLFVESPVSDTTANDDPHSLEETIDV